MSVAGTMFSYQCLCFVFWWTTQHLNVEVRWENTVWLRRRFQGKWITSYRLQATDEVVCKQENLVLKKSNVKQHHETNHKSYNKLTGLPVRSSIIRWLPELLLSHHVCLETDAYCTHGATLSIICSRVSVPFHSPFNWFDLHQLQWGISGFLAAKCPKMLSS